MDAGLWKIAGVATGLVAELVVLALLGWQGGAFLDRRFAMDPWLGLLGTALGVGLGVGIAIKTVLAMQAGDDS